MRRFFTESRNQIAYYIVSRLFALIIAFFITLPILWCALLSLKSNTDIFVNPTALPTVPQWTNYIEAWETLDFLKLFSNTIYISFFSISVGLSMVVLASFAIARMRLKNRKLQNALMVYFMSGLIIPSFVLLMPIYMMVSSIGLLDNLWGIILPYWGWTAPMNMMIIVASFKATPMVLDEAAAIDGCGCFGIFYRINLPLIKPALFTCLIICFLGCWNEYPLTSIIINSSGLQTIALAASKFKGMYTTNYANLAAALVILSVPQIVFFSFFQKYIVGGLSTGAVKA